MDTPSPSIIADDLKAECLKQRYTRQLAKPEVFPSADNWKYIIEHRMTGIGSRLYRKYLVSRMIEDKDRCDYHQAALDNFISYIKSVPRDYALKVVYGDIESCPEATIDVIVEAQLFDAPSLLKILGDENTYNLPWVTECLTAFQPEYNIRDLADMKNLLATVRNPDPVGKIVTSRTLLGQTTRYVCPNGHNNDAHDNYCRVCGLNIYGLTEAHDNIIDEYETRVNTLEKMLNKRPLTTD